jgi:PAS domain S-box-containing protein
MNNYGNVSKLDTLGRIVMDTDIMADSVVGYLEEFSRDRNLVRMFLEHIPAAVAMFDTEMRYVAVSRRWLKDYGIKEDVIGRSHYEVFPEIPEHWKEIHKRCLAGAVEQNNTEAFPRADGTKDWVRWEIHPWRNAGNEIFGIVMFTEIITDLVNAQEKLHRTIQQLEAKNRQLNFYLRELDAFGHSVSRDLRTPLRHTEGFARLLSENYADTLDVIGRRYLDIVAESCGRMNEIIDDLLDLSRLSRDEIEYEQVDLTSLANDIVRHRREVEPDRNLDYSIQDGMKARGDKRLLRLLLENLIDNSLKFSVNRERTRIEICSSEMEGERQFFVRDYGIGFSAPDPNVAFLPFKRLHPHEAFEGSGIGLATAHRIVRRHGGWIRAESESGKGTTIRFTLNAGTNGGAGK